jgi:hypothetical protein
LKSKYCIVHIFLGKVKVMYVEIFKIFPDRLKEL